MPDAGVLRRGTVSEYYVVNGIFADFASWGIVATRYYVFQISSGPNHTPAPAIALHTPLLMQDPLVYTVSTSRSIATW